MLMKKRSEDVTRKMNFLDVFLLKTKVKTTGKKVREKFIPVDDHFTRKWQIQLLNMEKLNINIVRVFTQ